MLGKHVLLVGPLPSQDRRVLAGLRAAGNEVLIATSESAAEVLSEAKAIDLAIVHFDPGAPELIDSLSNSSVPVIVVAEPETLHRALDHFAVSESNHVRVADTNPRSLLTAVEKTLRGDGLHIDTFIETYGVQLCSFTADSLAKARELADGVEDYLVALGAPRNCGEALSVVTLELLENAIFHGSRDLAGRPKYDKDALPQAYQIPPQERPVLRYGFDGTHFALSVTDCFGTLRPVSIRRSLNQGIVASTRMKSGKAVFRMKKRGGLFSAFHFSRELAFHIHKDMCTQVLVRIDPFSWQRDLSRGMHGVHLHVHEAAQDHSAPLPKKVVVSDSMMVDIRTHLAEHMAPTVVSPRPKRVASTSEEWIEEVTEEHATLLPLDDKAPVGIDTMFGLIRGANTEKQVLGLALRFVATCYHGAIAYRVHDDYLAPGMAIGTIANWQKHRMLRLRRDSGSALASAVHSKLTGPVELDPANPANIQLIATASGSNSNGCVVACVKQRGRVTHVIFAFGSRFKRPIAGRLLKTLSQEMKETMRRLRQERIEESGEYEAIEVTPLIRSRRASSRASTN